MPDLLTEGGIQGCGAGPGCEVVAVGNRPMSPPSARILAAPAGPTPCRSIRCEPRARTAVLSSLVRVFSLASVATRSASSSTAIRRVVSPTRDLGFTVAISRLALVGGEIFAGTAGDQLGQQPVKPVHGPDPPRRQLVATIGQQPQCDQFLVEAEHPQVRGPERCGRDRVGIGGVGLPRVPGVEDPYPGCQLRGDVDHRLTVSQQPLCQRAAHPVGTLDGPPVVRPLPADISEHRFVVPLLVPNLPVASFLPWPSMASMVTDFLWGSTPTITSLILLPPYP